MTGQHSKASTPQPVGAGSRWDALLGTEPGDDRAYIGYLLVIALAGWALASYDFDLLVTALPTIAADLNLSQTQVGLLGFFVYAAMLVISLVVGYCMDRFGRKAMWRVALIGVRGLARRQYAAPSEHPTRPRT